MFFLCCVLCSVCLFFVFCCVFSFSFLFFCLFCFLVVCFCVFCCLCFGLFFVCLFFLFFIAKLTVVRVSTSSRQLGILCGRWIRCDGVRLGLLCRSTVFYEKKTNRKKRAKNNRQFCKKGSKLDPEKGTTSDSNRRPGKHRR